MRLTELKLKNFRCYKDEISFGINDLTCIIGKNDVGKSTILEALDCFFNGTIDKGDLSADADGNIIEVTCVFEELSSKIVLDSSVETNPSDEKILNSKGQLEIKKEFKVGNTIGKATYLIALHPTHEDLINILSLKNAPLKALAEKVGADMAGVQKTKNPPIRQAIRAVVASPEEEIPIKVDGSLDTDNNLKAVWSKLKGFLPIYSIFKVDKNIDDKDKDVQDPMKQAIKESLAIPEIKELLERIEEEVKAKSSEVADRTLEKLKEIDESLAEKMKSDFNKVPTWDKIFDLTLLNENDIPLNKRGSGVKRLVLLSFFQAQAEKKKVEDNSPAIIYAIEEPETSQHPNHQKILINSLTDLSSQDNIQVLFTTHSSNLVKEIPIESLNYIHKTGEGLQIEYGINESGQVNSETLDKIIDTLGVLPNPKDSVKTLLFVEGNHDINALKEYSSILSQHDEDVINLNDNETIGVVISGGSSLKFYIDNKYLDGLGKPEVHIYDNDIADYRAYVAKINREGNPNKKAFNTSKLELENYLTKEAIEEAYATNGTVVTIPEITDEMDVPNTVARKLYETSPDKNWDDLEESKQKKRESRVKKLLNTQAVKQMTVERLQAREAYDDLKLWLDTIKSLN
ncbi:ATP-dependent nuclease [Pseudotamlana agarivorans]|uniref:ATP-dependent nuclease n=1 Tax=Pseudotamlana agarivorans TaxID=481183 RepID=UPI000836EC41|nr:ATP-binding protein [Tamlana agarivorans]